MANETALADHLRTTSHIDTARRSWATGKVGALYYVTFGEGGPVKIGFVDRFASLSERLRGLQTGCPYDLVLLATKAGSVADERDLHARFAGKRLRGEWFQPHPALLRHIEGVKRRRDCREWLAKHPAYLPAPEGFKKLRFGKKIWLVSAS